MVTAQDKPRSRLEEAPGAHEGAQVRSSPLTWATAATMRSRSCELCRVSAKAGWVFTSSRSWCADSTAGA